MNGTAATATGVISGCVSAGAGCGTCRKEGSPVSDRMKLRLPVMRDRQNSFYRRDRNYLPWPDHALPLEWGT